MLGLSVDNRKKTIILLWIILCPFYKCMSRSCYGGNGCLQFMRYIRNKILADLFQPLRLGRIGNGADLL